MLCDSRKSTFGKVKAGLECPRGFQEVNTLRTGEVDLRFYITTVQDG